MAANFRAGRTGIPPADNTVTTGGGLDLPARRRSLRTCRGAGGPRKAQLAQQRVEDVLHECLSRAKQLLDSGLLPSSWDAGSFRPSERAFSAGWDTRFDFHALTLHGLVEFRCVQPQGLVVHILRCLDEKCRGDIRVQPRLPTPAIGSQPGHEGDVPPAHRRTEPQVSQPSLLCRWGGSSRMCSSGSSPTVENGRGSPLMDRTSLPHSRAPHPPQATHTFVHPVFKSAWRWIACHHIVSVC